MQLFYENEGFLHPYILGHNHPPGDRPGGYKNGA